MIAGSIQENLRLVFEPAKCTRMDDSCTIPLKFRSIRMAQLRIFPATRIAGLLGDLLGVAPDERPLRRGARLRGPMERQLDDTAASLPPEAQWRYSRGMSPN